MTFTLTGAFLEHRQDALQDLGRFLNDESIREIDLAYDFPVEIRDIIDFSDFGLYQYRGSRTKLALWEGNVSNTIYVNFQPSGKSKRRPLTRGARVYEKSLDGQNVFRFEITLNARGRHKIPKSHLDAGNHSDALIKTFPLMASAISQYNTCTRNH